MKQKFNLIFIVFFLITSMSFAQTYSSLGTVNGGNPNWINLGTLSVLQGGNDAYIRIYGGSGYNASTSQMGYAELHIRTSNGVNVDANGFGFAASAVNYGRAGSAFISKINIVPNNSGVAATTYTIYLYCGNYLGNSFYSVETVGGTWTSSNSIATTAPAGYIVPFEYILQNNAYIGGQVGIGTTDTKGYQLAVNGTAIATSITVKAYGNWPDYVFKKDFQLPSLTDVKSYIDQNHHLPDVPSVTDVERDGLNLGEMNKVLVKKVEELTLYSIASDEQIREEKIIESQQKELLDKQQATLAEQQAQLKAQQAQINLLIKQVAALVKK